MKMGCGSSVQVVHPSALDQRIPLAVESRSEENEVLDAVTPLSTGIHDEFSVNPEPHKEFLHRCSPSALELNCRSTVAKLAPCNSEESVRREMDELFQQWRETGQLADIESYSLSTPPSLSASIVELSEYLTRNTSKYVKTLEGNELHMQVAKAYCIYSWIAHNITYDSQLWKAYQLGDDNCFELSADAEQVLDRHTAVSNGYAKLFKSLAKTAGLEADVLSGNIKEWKSQTMCAPEDDFKASRGNTHVWNLVTIGGIAFLLDCTLGSGLISPSAEYQQAFTSHFFLVKPQEFILTHWPQRTSQQLLKRPLGYSEFRPLIPLSSRATELGICPDTWSELLEIPTETSDPVVCITITCKAGVKILAKLIVKRELEGSSELTNCVFIHREACNTKKGTSDVRVRAVVPTIGWFVLNIYACKFSSHIPSDNYQLVLSYQIQSHTEIVSCSQIGYPIVYYMAAAAFDFQILHWNKPMPDYCCENSVGKLDIIFRARQDLHFFDYLVSGDAENPDDPDSFQTYNTLVAQNRCGDPNLYILRCVFPSPGFWSVHLSATKVIDQDSQQPTVSGYTSVFKYRVCVNHGVEGESFPHIKVPYISLNHPQTISASGNEVLKVQFHSTRELDFYTYLTFEMPTGEPFESYTILTAEGIQQKEPATQQHYNLGVIFPKPGRWYIHIYGKSLTNAEYGFTELMVFNVVVEGALKNERFPKIYSSVAAALKVGCYDTGCVSFADDGSPFEYKFRAPSSGVSLIPRVTPRNTDSNTFSEEYLQQCTFLSPSVADSCGSCVFTMNAIFPLAGTWSVQLFGHLSSSNSDDYNVVIYIQLQVSNPIPNKCFPTIFAPFYHLGLSLPNQSLLISHVIDESEMKLPFTSPDSVLFETRLTQGDELFVNQAIVEYIEDHVTGSVQDCKLHIIFPKAGDWVVHLYAGCSSVAAICESSDIHQNINKEGVLELRVKTLSFNDTLMFPQIFDPFYNKFSLKLAEEQYSLISKVNHFPSKVTIAFYSPPNVRFWHSVKLSTSLMVNSVTRMNSDPLTGLHELSVEITERGQWTVTLYARESNALDSQKWVAVLLHTIQAV